MTEPDWPVALPLDTSRLCLEPLRVEHAAELAQLLDDIRLHRFTGGEPLNETQLRERYQRQVAGRSPDGQQGWLNWVLRRRDLGTTVGTAQATVSSGPGGLRAALAWVVVVTEQGQGFATEAASAVVAALRQQNVRHFEAYVAPHHAASSAVAARLGLHPTDRVVDGEVVWAGE